MHRRHRPLQRAREEVGARLGFRREHAHRGDPVVDEVWFGGEKVQQGFLVQGWRMHGLQTSRWCSGLRNELRQKVAMVTSPRLFLETSECM
jgi:hypothetical protein